MKHSALVLSVVVATLAGGATLADDVSGIVVDAYGQAVANVDVATFWSGSPEGMSAYEGVKTDKDGRFTLTADFYGRAGAVLAIDTDRKHGGLITYDPNDIKTGQYKVTLVPLIEVKGDFFCEEFNAKPTWTNVYMNLMPGRMRVASSMSKEAKFEFKLPPGTYEFWAYGTDVRDYRKEITLEADEPVVDMKTINLEATVIAQHYGKAPPAWNVTDARDVGSSVQLADYKGRYVLLEFWGYW